jgi:hypothetical protein
MKLKWKNKTSLKPQIILDKIETAKTVSPDGKVSYSAFDYHDAFAALFSMIDFPKIVEEELSVDSVVSEALGQAAASGVITKEIFIEKLNSVIRSKLATRENTYHLLTSFSMTGELPFKQLEFKRVRLRVVDVYAKKFGCRGEIISKANDKFSHEHSSYSKVIVTTKSKTAHGASSRSIRVLDTIRALLCMFSNSSMELFGDNFSPINRIRLGEVHTLHKDNGSSATENTVWFEPDFIEAKPYLCNKVDVLKKNIKWAMNKLDECSYSDVVKDALLRYVRALDESNHNTALLRIWGALECLAAPSASNYDSVTRRCAFIFDESEYHQQILEHLREFRNKSVHAGDQSERAKTYCFQLQFYFQKMVLFHLKSVKEFSSLDQANSFLDLPTDKSSILERKRMLDKAIKYRRINA